MGQIHRREKYEWEDELDAQIAAGWGDISGDEIPRNWRDVRPPVSPYMHYVRELEYSECQPERRRRKVRKPRRTLAERIGKNEAWLRERLASL